MAASITETPYQIFSSACTRTRCMAAMMAGVILFFFMTYRIPEMSFIPIITFGISNRVNTNSTQTPVTHDENNVIPIPRTAFNNTLDYSRRENKTVSDVEILKNIVRMRKVGGVDCKALYNDSLSEIQRAKNLAKTVTQPIPDSEYLKLTVDCNAFHTQRGYILSSLTKEEKEFPLAYSILVFKEAEMVERLLRAIYRPQNYYCIHVDQKSPDTFFKAISAIAKCFPNVFLASKRIDVQWGWFSILEPELLCMEELWRYPKWKYFINLTGQEFPLKTNYELVKILTAYDGANDLEGTIKRANKDRFRSIPPLGITAIKGSVHITVNRDYVDYVLHNDTAKALLEWAKKNTSVPDETYFATINHNPQLGVRGTYKGEPETNNFKPFLTRYKNWGGSKCASGQYVRAICILTLGDLPALGQAKHYFANKFYLSEDRVVIGCLEEKNSNDTLNELTGDTKFDTSFYANLSFVKNKI